MKESNKGQLLVITLLVIIIITIVVMSTVVNLSRDVTERVFNEQYEENYSVAESRLIQASEFFANFDYLGGSILTPQEIENYFKNNPLNLNADFFDQNCTQGATANIIICTIVEGEITTDLTIELIDEIADFEITSNDAIHVNLKNLSGTSYTGPLNVSWTGNDVLWSIGLVYKKNYSGDLYFEILKDTYDRTGFTERPSAGSRFNFIQIPNVNPINGFRLASLAPASINDDLVKNINLSSGGEGYEYLRLRPIMPGGGTTTVSINGSGLPGQFLEVTAQSYQTGNESSTPTPLLSIKKPLLVSPPGVFDYVYYTNSRLETQD